MGTGQCGATQTASLNEARLEALLTLSQMTEASLQEITDFALEQGVLLTRSKIGYLSFVNEDETVLTMHSWSRNAMERCQVSDQTFVYPLETTGLWGEALRQRRPIVTNDYAAANPWKRGLPEGHVPIVRHMNVPIFDGGRVVVVAGVGNKREPYDDSDVRQLTLLMDGMWKLLQRQRTQAKLRAYQIHLEQLVEMRTAELNQEIDKRKKAHEALRKEQEELKRLLAMHDRDRQLIGFEIHDGLTQLLAGSLMRLETFLRTVSPDDRPGWEQFHTGVKLLREGLGEARRLISGLRSATLEDLGLVAAVEELVAQIGRLEGTPQLEFAHRVAFDRLPPPLENTMYRIVQEALTNACRHSRSPRVRAEISQEGQRVQIEIRDWGIGFDPSVVKEGHYGLDSIQQRARLFGGQATIESQPGEGTRIRVELPLPEH
jgi:signal transduction histidine kinase